ncbi:MAG: AAA domain-containing protein [Cellulosilyticaceae bacterium]
MKSSSHIHMSNLLTFLKQYRALRSPLISDLEQEPWFLWLDSLSHLEPSATDSPFLTITKDSSLFEISYDLYEQLHKEPEGLELLLGNGMLYHTSSNQTIHYPLILQAVTLHFDPSIPEFKLCLSRRSPYLCKTLLQNSSHVRHTCLKNLFNHYDNAPFSPLTFIQNPNVLNQLAYAYHTSPCILKDATLLQMHDQQPQFYCRPVLILHKRRHTSSVTIDRMLQDLGQYPNIPSFIEHLFDLPKTGTSSSDIYPSVPTLDTLRQQLLMAKPTNFEQLLVAHHLQHQDAVLVQGPPGTGKSHTIANIVGHLLSEGKRVLITGASEKALSVIYQQIPASLHVFCMHLFSHTQTQETLEHQLLDLHHLRSQLETIDLPQIIQQLENKSHNLQHTHNHLIEKINQLSESQSATIQLGDHRYEANQVASWLHNGQVSASDLKALKCQLTAVQDILSLCSKWEISCIDAALNAHKLSDWKHLCQTLKHIRYLETQLHCDYTAFMTHYPKLLRLRKQLRGEWEQLLMPHDVLPLEELHLKTSQICREYGVPIRKWLDWTKSTLHPLLRKCESLHLLSDDHKRTDWANLGGEVLPKLLHQLDLLITLTETLTVWHDTPLAYDEMIHELTATEETLEEVTTELIFYKTWSHTLTHFEHNQDQVQAIASWKQLIHQIGSGRSKNASNLRAEARRLLPSCQQAIPIWLMPLEQVLSYFTPDQNQFDVVIIDEASQVDMLGIIALYFGKKVLIVGDDQQVSPLAIGENQQLLQQLIDAHLYDIPHAHLYSGKFSLYDLAHIAGYQPIQLKQHFRSIPSIIDYPNRWVYDNCMVPLRPEYPHTVGDTRRTVQVTGAQEIDGVNDLEADIIVNLIVDCIQEPQYMDKSFGVISLKGEKQAALIASKLHQKLSPSQYLSHQILCGVPSHFQGDERDVLFLSMVETPQNHGTLRLLSEGMDDLYKKRYNVALSRAKEQLWLIHSFDPNKHLKTGDLRKELFDAFRQGFDCSLSDTRRLSESEQYLLAWLIHLGYDVHPAKAIGSVNISLIVKGLSTQVALICEEGYNLSYRLDATKMIVSKVQLQRLGWHFIHIPVTVLSTALEKQMDTIVTQLGYYGVHPHILQATTDLTS